MAFSDSFIDELKARVDLAEIVGRRVRLIRKGRSITGLCPFHNEKTPSFTVQPDKGFYHCFGCGKHGDAISFVCETEGLSFREAVERLAEGIGMALPAESRQSREEMETRRTLYDVMVLAQEFFRAQFEGRAGAAARAYAEKRGLSAATLERFGFGYAPDGRTQLISALTAKGVSANDLHAAGLALRPEGSSDLIDFFRNRLTVPIRDVRGRVIAFGARTLLPDGKPKYLNTGETELFHKGRTLFNLDQARKPAFDAQRLIVAEGYLDVVALSAAGFTESVAPLGTALTEDQLGLMWRIAPEPILCFDGDAAGQRAASRALDRALPLLKAGQSLRFAFLPEGLDPDDLIRRDGPAAMQEVLRLARPLIEVLWARETKDADLSTPERRAGLEKRLDNAIGVIADETVRGHYRREVKDRLWTLFRPAASKPRPGPQRAMTGRPARGRGGAPLPPLGASLPPEALQGSPRTGSLTEQILALLLVRHPAIALKDYETAESLEFSTAELVRLHRQALAYAAAQEVLDPEPLLTHLLAQGFGPLIRDLERRAALAALKGAGVSAEPSDAEVLWRAASMRLRSRTALAASARAARAALADSDGPEVRARIAEADAALAAADDDLPSSAADNGTIF